MDAADLRVFETVARLGGIGRAARALNTVQSNVTSRVRLLEQDLGLALFERHARGVTLTAAGQRLLPYAAELRDLLQRARRDTIDDGTPRGPLAIGTLETTLAIRLPRIIADFAARYPAVDLSLRTGTTAESITRVLERELDAAFVAGPLEHPDLTEELMVREELVLLTPPSMRELDALSRVEAVKLLVLRVGCSYRQRLEAILAARGIVNTRTLEFGSLDAITGCVAAGIGITLLPRSLVDAAARSGELWLHTLPPQEAMVDTLFIRRCDNQVGSALAAFRRIALATRAETQASAAE